MSHIPYYNQPDTEGKPMNKNGYEIRTELVAIAKDYIEKQHAANVEYANKLLELGQIHQAAYTEMMKPYSLEDIVKQASKIYEFVTDKK